MVDKLNDKEIILGTVGIEWTVCNQYAQECIHRKGKSCNHPQGTDATRARQCIDPAMLVTIDPRRKKFIYKNGFLRED
jgi:hypothetical protein